MNILTGICLLFFLGSMLAGCTPADSGEAAQAAATVKIGASASVRVNGKPLARAADGDNAGKPLLNAACAGSEGLELSPNVRINGAPASVVKPGATTPRCPAGKRLDTAANVEVGN